MHSWSSWSFCSATCGEGQESRTREVDQPQFGGRECGDGGKTEEIRGCSHELEECPQEVHLVIVGGTLFYISHSQSILSVYLLIFHFIL